MLKNDITYNLFYGTRNLELDINPDPSYTPKINPDFNGKRMFEFGNGFYLTPNRDLAESYIRVNYKIEEIKKIELHKSTLDTFKKGINIIGHLHIYNLNYTKLVGNTDVKEFEKIEDFKTVLKETLDGYDNNEDYRPERDATFGAICGKFWDDYWADDNPKRDSLSHDDLIEQCIQELETKRKLGIDERQICIHKLLVGTDKKNVFKEYLIKDTYKEIIK